MPLAILCTSVKEIAFLLLLLKLNIKYQKAISRPDIMTSHDNTAVAQRIEQMERTVRKFVNDFVKPSPDFEASDFLSSYSPRVEWYDHAFHIKRVGHDAVLGLLKGFTTCNDPFKSHILVPWFCLETFYYFH